VRNAEFVEIHSLSQARPARPSQARFGAYGLGLQVYGLGFRV